MMPPQNDRTPTPRDTNSHGGRHHERPGSIPVAALVPFRPDLPSGRRRAGVLAQAMRTLRGTS